MRCAVPPLALSAAMKSPSAGIPVEAAVGDRRVDARQILHHDAAGADIHVADLGIPHLAVGQADIVLARLQLRVRAVRHEAVPIRRPGQEDGVVVAVGALAPAVQDAQDDGTGTTRLRHGHVL